MIFQGSGPHIPPLDLRMRMIANFQILEDRFSHVMVHFPSVTSKHDEVHDSAIFYLVLHH